MSDDKNKKPEKTPPKPKEDEKLKPPPSHSNGEYGERNIKDRDIQKR